jgi:hypothetical protein
MFTVNLVRHETGGLSLFSSYRDGDTHDSIIIEHILKHYWAFLNWFSPNNMIIEEI